MLHPCQTPMQTQSHGCQHNVKLESWIFTSWTYHILSTCLQTTGIWHLVCPACLGGSCSAYGAMIALTAVFSVTNFRYWVVIISVSGPGPNQHVMYIVWSSQTDHNIFVHHFVYMAWSIVLNAALYQRLSCSVSVSVDLGANRAVCSMELLCVLPPTAIGYSLLVIIQNFGSIYIRI